jgi:crossover junction endodeoxyribonuclease RusA
MRYELRLPWTTPPLSANQRLHWRAQAARVAKVRGFVREAVAWSTYTDHPWPIDADHVDVTLTYYPRDRRRRDADNLVPTLKACADGLVDAGVTRDDTPDLMRKHMPVIAAPDGDPRLVLTVEVTQP